MEFTMQPLNNYQSSQLDAIQKFYYKLLERGEKSVSMAEAIIAWFSEGHAEEFREEYLRRQLAMMH